MATRKGTTRSKSTKKKKPTLRQLYAKLRKEFTAADLQKYTVIEEMIPAEVVMAEMDRILLEETDHQAKIKAKRKTK